MYTYNIICLNVNVFCMFLIPIILTFIHFIPLLPLGWHIRSVYSLWLSSLAMISFSLWVSFDIIFLVGYPQNETRLYIRIMIDEVLTNTEKHSNIFQKKKFISIVQNAIEISGFRKDIFHIIWILPEQFESLFLWCCTGHLTYIYSSMFEILQTWKIARFAHCILPSECHVRIYFVIRFYSIENIIVSTFVSCLSEPFAPRWIFNVNNLFCLQRNMIECKFTQMLFECSFICNTAGCRLNVFVLINTIVYTFKHSIFSTSTIDRSWGRTRNKQKCLWSGYSIERWHKHFFFTYPSFKWVRKIQSFNTISYTIPIQFRFDFKQTKDQSTYVCIELKLYILGKRLKDIFRIHNPQWLSRKSFYLTFIAFSLNCKANIISFFRYRFFFFFCFIHFIFTASNIVLSSFSSSSSVSFSIVLDALNVAFSIICHILLFVSRFSTRLGLTQFFC